MYEYVGVVERVIDGDTVIARIDLGFRCWVQVRVRLAGVFAPELKKRKSEPDGQGELAAWKLEDELPVGTAVRIVSLSLDKYGRSVAQIWRVADGECVTAIMADYLRDHPVFALDEDNIRARARAERDQVAT
jgi:endonuclease YncB( thermonuclease family)